MQASAIHRVLVIGAGTSGRQIALQFARFGISVTIQDVDRQAIDACPEHLRNLLATLVADGVVDTADPNAILDRIRCTTDPGVAAREVDLLIESVTENVRVKREVLAGFDPLCPSRTIFTTNTSYLLPSSLAVASGRPDRFAAYHFHVPVWHANAVDVMPHPRTAPEVVQTLCDLAWRIGQVPVRSRRENPGYVFNAILHPMLLYSLDLAAREVADFEDIDRAWMAITKMPVGPFGIVDQIGLDTVHRILETWGRWLPGNQAKGATALLRSYLDQNRSGQKSGHGFYHYPNPVFADPAFLQGEPGPATIDAVRVTERYVPQPIPSGPLFTGPEQVQFSGGAMVVGRDSTATRLVERLRDQGLSVAQVPDGIAVQDTAAWMEHRWQTAPYPHLFLISDSCQDLEPEDDADGRWFARGVSRPFAVAQAWFRLLGPSLGDGRATLVALSRIGGRFGFDNRVPHAEGGGLTGLVKSIAVESTVRARPGIATRCVDLATGVSPDEAIDLCWSELAAAQAEIVTGDVQECLRRHVGIEVGYDGQQRFRIRHRRQPARQRVPAAAEPYGTWLVSGGSGGITMQVALSLAREFGLRLQVLGRTALPDTDYLTWSDEALATLRKEVMRSAYQRGQKPNTAWHPYERAIAVQKALQSYREAGVDVEYHACDVSDRGRLQQIVHRLRERGQPVTGVLHGAGVERSTRFELKTWDVAESTLRPKTLGTRALIDVTRTEPLDWFIAFGSLSGRFGSSGQADYAMANEMMAKMVTGLRRGPRACRGLTVHWPAWEDIGMAAHPENRYLLEKAEHRLMPVAEGLQHILQEIRSGVPDPEIVIVSAEEIERKLQAEHESHEPEPRVRSPELTTR